jgi:hypothetical protein
MGNRKGAFKTFATFRRGIRTGCSGATIKFAGRAGNPGRVLLCHAIDLMPQKAKPNALRSRRYVLARRRRPFRTDVRA